MATDPDPTKAPKRQSPDDVQRLARWLDEAFTIPGTRYRVGWDAIIGLIPGAGELVTTVPAIWIVMRAVSLGVSNVVAARMVLNILIDSVIGAIPVLGDLFDVAWKANRRNVRLLDRYQQDPAGTRRRSTASVAGAAVVLLVVAAGLVLLPILVLVLLVQALNAAAA